MRTIFLLLLLFFAEAAHAVTCGNKLSSAQKDTLAWLEKYYLYPKDGPGYDWPNSYQPRLIANQVYAIDGTRIDVHPWAYDITLGKGQSLGPEFPEASVQYSVNSASAEESQKILEDLADLFKKRFKIDILKLPKKQYASVYEIKSHGKSHDLTIQVPSEKGLSGGKFSVSFSIHKVQHFFFSRNHIMVIDDKVKLSDGTVVAILPQAKTCDINVGTIEGSPAQISLNYTYTITNVPALDDEFQRLYKFYADAYKFDAAQYKLWDETMDMFIIAYKNAEHEIRVSVAGPSKDKGLHSAYKATGSDTFSHLSAQLFLFNKKQIVPGYNQPLYRSQHSDEVGTPAMAKYEIDPVQEANSKRPTGGGSQSGGDEEASSGPGLFGDVENAK